MKLIYGVLPLVLGGCASVLAPINATSSTMSRADLSATCESGANCRFVNSPVQVDRNRMRRIASRKVPFYPTLAQLDFVDGGGSTWVAPKGIVTDGASIPPIFVPIVGAPTAPEFVNAAAVHDAYCGIGNEQGVNFHAATWQRVHIMFYDALRVGGVPEIKAKVMFAAVWLGGPRWDDVEFQPSEQPRGAMQAAMVRTRLFVEGSNPSFDELLEYLSGQERSISRVAALSGARGGGGGGAGSAPAGQDAASPGHGGSAPSGETAGEGTGEGAEGEAGDSTGESTGSETGGATGDISGGSDQGSPGVGL